MKTRKMRTKLSALLLAFVMVISMMPTFTIGARAGGDTVTVTVANNTAFTQTEGAAWDGSLLNAISVPVSPGDTVLDVLSKALTLDVNGVQDYTSAGISAGYVTEIGGLIAGDATAAGKNAAHPYWDGWCFAVNNVVPGVGMGAVYVENGDAIHVEYALDGTVSGADWGSCNGVTSGFAFSAGVFSYVTGTYGNSYTLTLPDQATIQIAAVPNPDSKAVRIYNNGIITDGLNSDISAADGDRLQIVIGDYEDVSQVTVRTVEHINAQTLKTGIADAFNGDISSYWNIVGMMANNSGYVYSDTARQTYLDTAIDNFVNPTSYSATTMAMHIVAMTALGYDVTQMIDGGASYNAYDILKAQVTADTSFGGWTEVYAYSLMAYLQATAAIQAVYASEINAAIADLSAHPTGDWGDGASADSAGVTLAALCMAESKGYTVDSTARATAVTYLEGAVKADGTVEDSYYSASNANSTAMTILGLDAAGVDVSAVTESGSGNTLLAGLLLYATGDDSGFTYSGDAVNISATQQGFLALIAASDSGATDVFDFSGSGTAIPESGTAYIYCPVIVSAVPTAAAVSMTKSGEEVPETAVIPGRYDLQAGSYTCLVSYAGYNDKTVSYTVTPEDAVNHIRKALSVSLASAPEADSDITVTVYVKVPADDAGTYTYKNNPSAYSDTVSQTLTIESGSTVFDALDAALTSAGKTYVETTYGYITTIDSLSVFDRGSKSGWLYSVNGTTAKVNCRSYTLTRDSAVVWFYTDDYTNEYGSESWSGDDVPTSSETSVTGALNKNTGAASAVLSGSVLNGFNKVITNGKDVVGSEAPITVFVPDGATALNLTIPQSVFTALSGTSNTSLYIKTDFANLKFDPKSIDSISLSADSGGVAISVSKVDISTLSGEAKELIGDRPVYDFSVAAGNTGISDFGGGSVRVSIPYTPGADENENAVVVYCIDASGTLRAIRGAYHAETGTVEFAVSHFSEYAVGYNEVTFSDADGTAWYSDAVTFCAARGIARGTGGGAFGPESALTRGQYIVMLMRAYGIEADENPTDNFADAGDTYYTDYLAAAKRLGISAGVGGGMFAPDICISRQDMFTLLYRAFNILGEKPAAAGGKTLADYTDASVIPEYARTAMEAFVESGAITGSDGKLCPGGSATRAQTAQVLYNLLSA